MHDCEQTRVEMADLLWQEIQDGARSERLLYEIDSCDVCRFEYAENRRAMDAFAAGHDAFRMSEAQRQRQERNLRRELAAIDDDRNAPERDRRRFWTWGLAGATAALACCWLFVVNRERVTFGTGQSQVSRSSSFRIAHVQRVERLWRVLDVAERPAELSRESGALRDLLADNTMFRLQAEFAGETQTANDLERLELVLLDLAHPEVVTTEDWGAIRDRMQRSRRLLQKLSDEPSRGGP